MPSTITVQNYKTEHRGTFDKKSHAGASKPDNSAVRVVNAKTNVVWSGLTMVIKLMDYAGRHFNQPMAIIADLYKFVWTESLVGTCLQLLV